MIRALVVLSILGLGWWWSGPSSDEFVAYPAFCINGISILPRELSLRTETPETFERDYKKYREDRANCVIVPGNRTVYKLNSARAEAYYVTGDFDTPGRLVNCAIVSRTNWICSYPDRSGKIAVTNGLRAIHIDELKQPAPHFFYQRRWQWWAAALYYWVGQPRGAWLIPEQHVYF